MGDTVILAIYFPAVIVGMGMVIMWGMSAAGSRHKGFGQDGSERMHSREV